jgi:hypothetical protein
VLLQFAWAASVAAAYVRSRRRGERDWAGAFLFLGAYWAAFVVNATFDVFLEGPMGAIWFWSLYGVGLAAVWIHRHAPDVLADGRT